MIAAPSIISPRSGPHGVRPRPGLKPKRPQAAAGTRIEPPRSLAPASGDNSGRHRRRRAAGRTAWRACEIPWVQRRAPRGGLGDELHAEFRRIRAAEDHHAGLQPTHRDFRVHRRHEALRLQAARTVRAGNARIFLGEVLLEEGNAGERSRQRLRRAAARDFVHAGHDRVDARTDRIGARDRRFERFGRRNLLFGDKPSEPEARRSGDSRRTASRVSLSRSGLERLTCGRHPRASPASSACDDRALAPDDDRDEFARAAAHGAESRIAALQKALQLRRARPSCAGLCIILSAAPMKGRWVSPSRARAEQLDQINLPCALFGAADLRDRRRRRRRRRSPSIRAPIASTMAPSRILRKRVELDRARDGHETGLRQHPHHQGRDPADVFDVRAQVPGPVEVGEEEFGCVMKARLCTRS